MNILMLCKTFPSSVDEAIVSGEVKNAFYLARQLRKMGHSVDVLATGDVKSEHVEGVNVRRSRRAFMAKGFFKSVLENIGDLYYYVVYLRSGAPYDAILNQKLTSPVFILLFSRLVDGARVVNTAHVTNWPEINANRASNLRGLLTYLNGYVQLLFDRLSYRMSDVVVSVSEFQEKELSEVYKLPPSKIVTIRNGIDLDIYNIRANNMSFSAEQKKVLFVGRLVRKKGLGLILKVAEIVREQELPIVFQLVVGSPEYAKIRPWFQAELESKSLDDICEVIWCVPEKTLPSLYQSSDLFIAPSEGYESLPTVLLEALACGVPVLTTKAWGTIEAIQDERMLIHERSPEAVLRQIITLLESPPEAGKLRDMVSGIRWSVQAERYEEVLRRPPSGEKPEGRV